MCLHNYGFKIPVLHPVCGYWRKKKDHRNLCMSHMSASMAIWQGRHSYFLSTQTIHIHSNNFLLYTFQAGFHYDSYFAFKLHFRMQPRCYMIYMLVHWYTPLAPKYSQLLFGGGGLVLGPLVMTTPYIQHVPLFFQVFPDCHSNRRTSLLSIPLQLAFALRFCLQNIKINNKIVQKIGQQTVLLLA